MGFLLVSLVDWWLVSLKILIEIGLQVFFGLRTIKIEVTRATAFLWFCCLSIALKLHTNLV